MKFHCYWILFFPFLSNFFSFQINGLKHWKNVLLLEMRWTSLLKSSDPWNLPPDNTKSDQFLECSWMLGPIHFYLVSVTSLLLNAWRDKTLCTQQTVKTSGKQTSSEGKKLSHFDTWTFRNCIKLLVRNKTLAPLSDSVRETYIAFCYAIYWT